MTPDQKQLLDLRADREQWRQAAADATARIEEILDTYGHGIRPAWVSGDIAIEAERRDRYEARARTIGHQIDTIEKRLRRQGLTVPE